MSFIMLLVSVTDLSPSDPADRSAYREFRARASKTQEYKEEVPLKKKRVRRKPTLRAGTAARCLSPRGWRTFSNGHER